MRQTCIIHSESRRETRHELEKGRRQSPELEIGDNVIQLPVSAAQDSRVDSMLS